MIFVIEDEWNFRSKCTITVKSGQGFLLCFVFNSRDFGTFVWANWDPAWL